MSTSDSDSDEDIKDAKKLIKAHNQYRSTVPDTDSISEEVELL